jgi:hypothetical protein
MERVLMMLGRASGCSAEVWINDIPVAAMGATVGDVSLPIHEYILAGDNTITLVIDPVFPHDPEFASTPKLAASEAYAHVRLLLPRVGELCSQNTARTLFEFGWTVAEGEIYQAPLVHNNQVMLPIKFPRWRWMDAPKIDDFSQEKAKITAFLQRIAVAMAQGEFEPLITASQLRLEELAVAYQQPVETVKSRFLSRLKLLHATKALKMTIPTLSELVLRPCANMRLVETLTADGSPMLKTLPAADGSRTAWPVRIAMVNGQCHIFR